ncbi:hypothetical protein Tco_1170236, partial [Tanacetum coccineum]
NDKSIDTTKARQDLKNLDIRSELWLGQNKNGKCSKPHAKYSFTPDNRKKFYQFIKGVKLPDRFGSNFKHKVTNNDSNITGMKFHDYHIMMQRLLPYGLQQYLHIDVAKPIIELCSFFKQICSRTLMEDDMVKAESQLVDILSKSEVSKLESYVAEEALNFSSHYVRSVLTKFRPDRNMDCPPPTCQFQVFQSICRSIGKRSIIRLDQQELKKVICLNDLDFATLNIDGPSTDVEAPPDIIDVDEDDDFINDKDDVPQDLANSNDEVLVNDDDDDDVIVVDSTSVARGDGGDDGGDDPSLPPLRPIRIGFQGRKPNREAGEGGKAVDWGSKGVPDVLPFWHKIEEKKVGVLGKLMQHFDLTPHIQSKLWPKIKKGIEEHMAKASDPDLSRTSSRKSGISILTIGLTLSKLPEAFKMLKTKQRARSSASRDPSHLLSSEISSSETREYPSLIQTFFDTHTQGGKFAQDEARVQYVRGDDPAEVSRRQYANGCALHRGLDNGHGSKGQAARAYSWCWQGLGRTRQGRHLYQRCTYTDADVDEVKEDNKLLRKELAMLRTVIRNDNHVSELLTQLESQHEVCGGRGSGGGGDDEPARRVRTYMSSGKVAHVIGESWPGLT